MTILICCCLALALGGALGWAFMLKAAVRLLSAQLAGLGADTNTGLTTSTVDRDVAKLASSINLALERGRQELWSKDRAQADLKQAITNVSHDLRTPLTAASGYVQMLRFEQVDPEQADRYLNIIAGRLDTLSSLVDELFEYARVVEPGTISNRTSINVTNLVRDALSTVHSDLEDRGFQVDLELPETPVICWCDQEAMSRILANLLRNVVTHGKRYLRVRLDEHTLEVANQADHLNQLNVSRLFDRFYTGDASRTSGSTGLGLAIAQALTTQMGAEIRATVESDLLVIRVTWPK